MYELKKKHTKRRIKEDQQDDCIATARPEETETGWSH